MPRFSALIEGNTDRTDIEKRQLRSLMGEDGKTPRCRRTHARTYAQRRDLGELHFTLGTCARVVMGRTLSEDIGVRSEEVGCWHSTDEGSEQRGKRSGGATGGKGSSQGEPDSQSTCWAQYQISVYQAAVKRVRVCESRDDCLSRLAVISQGRSRMR